MRARESLLILGVLILALAPIVQAATYELDTSHSSVGFTIRHMVISKVKGEFDRFEGSFEFELDKPEAWSVEASVDANSINTKNEKRDEHLRSDDFLNVAEFPTLSFRSIRVEQHKGGALSLHGELTLHGVTRPVVFALEFNGVIDDPWGNRRAGFSASTTIDRKDYGLTWSKALETGGLVVGDEVEINIEVEGVKKKGS